MKKQFSKLAIIAFSFFLFGGGILLIAPNFGVNPSNPVDILFFTAKVLCVILILLILGILSFIIFSRKKETVQNIPEGLD